jgi:hypothetical protein
MTTEEVAEMIEAITEGKIYATSFEGRSLDGLRDGHMEIAVAPAGFGFKIGHELFDLVDPNTAREIAAALVAWANRKNGMMKGSARAILGDIRWAEFNDEKEGPENHV